MVEYKKPKYQTINWPDYNNSLKKRGSLTIWLDPSLSWYATSSDKRGRPATYTDQAIECCLTIKALFQLPLRQTIGLLESLFSLAKLDWNIPDISTLSRRLSKLKIIPTKALSTHKSAMHLLVDSTGIKLSETGDWLSKKHQVSKRQKWLKLHIAIDAEALSIQSLIVTDSSTGDSQVFPELLKQINPEQKIEAIYADGAYDTKGCYQAIEQRGANAIIPPRKNAQPWKGEHPRNQVLKAVHYISKASWKRLSGYHKRSLVETKMHCIKRLGEKVMSRRFERQVAELTIRAALLNQFTLFGRPHTIRVS